MNTFIGYENIRPLIQPADLGTTATATEYVNLKGSHRCAFLLQMGVTTENATTDIIDVTIEAATAEGGTEAAVAFNYRLSGLVTANTWGAITAATTTGAELNNETSEGYTLWAEVDVDALAANDYSYVRMRIEMNAFSAFFCSVVCFLDTRYKMTTFQSSTASASA
jgi:hypothetical protein